ncbi:MAG: hypothetical protein IT364_02970 [Candidatus Hydrogenedentes bacterium]|nr:hypothetical protein [Candidatus Hydrogenedentota bacterium]
MTRSERHGHEGDRYLEQYPKLQKWINQCLLCGARGYEPCVPDEIMPWPTAATRILKRFFPPLAVHENGHCEVCAKVVGKKAKDSMCDHL